MQFLRAATSLLCFVAASALAQAGRDIPDQAKPGAITHLQDMIVAINGVRVRLAPGVQIRDQNNFLIVPTAVPPGSQVKYLLDQDGMVRQIWILTPDEAQQGAAKN